MVDVHRGHLTEEFRSSLSSMSTNVFFIPSGCSCRLQPLDVCVTPVLQDFLQVAPPVFTGLHMSSPVSPVFTRLPCLHLFSSVPPVFTCLLCFVLLMS